jgi:hypothetical protein
LLLYWLSPKIHYQAYLDTDDLPGKSWFFKRPGSEQ